MKELWSPILESPLSERGFRLSHPNLTPFGNWLFKRLPWIEKKRRNEWFDGDFGCWRVYGCRPYSRLCLFDWTAEAGDTGWRHRVRLFNRITFRWETRVR